MWCGCADGEPIAASGEVRAARKRRRSAGNSADDFFVLINNAIAGDHRVVQWEYSNGGLVIAHDYLWWQRAHWDRRWNHDRVTFILAVHAPHSKLPSAFERAIRLR